VEARDRCDQTSSDKDFFLAADPLCHRDIETHERNKLPQQYKLHTKTHHSH